MTKRLKNVPEGKNNPEYKFFQREYKKVTHTNYFNNKLREFESYINNNFFNNNFCSIYSQNERYINHSILLIYQCNNNAYCVTPILRISRLDLFVDALLKIAGIYIAIHRKLTIPEKISAVIHVSYIGINRNTAYETSLKKLIHLDTNFV